MAGEQGGTPDVRVLKLRYPTKCAVCFRALERGALAEWNRRCKVAICIPCTQRRPGAAATSVAGMSARAVAARRRDKQAARLQAEREARPILGRLRQALAPEADAGAQYAKGALGEEALGASLQPMVTSGVIEVLHDRRMPGSRANIDHLVISRAGVWVIDAKRYAGRITTGVRGGFFSSRTVLTVQGRDRTKLVEGVHKQVDAVRATLAEMGIDDVPVRGALCFVDGDWSIFRRRPFTVSDVLVTWPKALRERLAEPGPSDAERRTELQRSLAIALPPAS